MLSYIKVTRGHLNCWTFKKKIGLKSVFSVSFAFYRFKKASFINFFFCKRYIGQGGWDKPVVKTFITQC